MIWTLFSLACQTATPPGPRAYLPDSPPLPNVTPAFEATPMRGLSGPPRAGFRGRQAAIEIEGPSPWAVEVRDPMDGLFNDVEGTWDQSRGQQLVDYVAQLPEERRKLGIVGVDAATLTEMCEAPVVTTTFEHVGETWEARFLINLFQYYPGDLEPDLHTISTSCAEALDAEPLGDVLGAATCDDDEPHNFWEGSSCRTCLEAGDGWSDCLARDQCVVDAPVRYPFGLGNPYGPDVYGVVSTVSPACAPDFVAPVKLLYRLDDARPQPLAAYDFDRWAAYCFQYWDDGEVTEFCSTGVDTWGSVLGSGMLTQVETVRPVDESRLLHNRRMAYSGAIRVDGLELRTKWLTWDTVAPVATPRRLNGLGFERDPTRGVQAWGYEPYELRPGGTDPADPNDTYAREFVGGVALKTSTTLDGVSIFHYTRNRCADDGWERVDEDRWRCTDLGDAVVDPETVTADAAEFVGSVGSRQIRFSMPMTTLASTGLPDATIPGGFVVDVRGSTALANPDWDECAWPQQFEPDLSVYDEVPEQPGGSAPLVGQTYRFGKEAADEPEVRIALNTNTVRGYCPTFD